MPKKKSKVVAAPAARMQPKTRNRSIVSPSPIPSSSASPVVGSAMISAMPATTGVTTSRATFGFGGQAQALADFDPANSLRIVGRDLFYLPIQAGSATPAAGFGGMAVYNATVSPGDIAARLANVEKIFQWYAIRRLRIVYAPATGSTSTVQVALGYMSNYMLAVGDIQTPTQTQVLEMQPSVLFPAWQPAAIEMIHRGTKLFSTQIPSTPTKNYFDYFQGTLSATLLNGVASTVYGQLWVDYVVDFYQPCPVLSNVSRRLLTFSSGLEAHTRFGFNPIMVRRGTSIHHSPEDESKEEKKDSTPPTQPAAPACGESDDGIIPDVEVVTLPTPVRSVRESAAPSRPALPPLRGK